MKTLKARLTALVCFCFFFSPIISLAMNCENHASFQLCKDITYSPVNAKVRILDVYQPMDSRCREFKPVVLIHGGCFTGGDKSDLFSAAQRLLQAGQCYVPISINYTLAVPRVSGSYDATLADLTQLMVWLHGSQAQALKIDPSWVAAYGESAGGTLAGYLGTRPFIEMYSKQKRAAVDVVLDFYGRTDFVAPQPRGSGRDCPTQFLNASREHHPELFERASVRPVIGIQPARFFMAHSFGDPQVSIYHSAHLKQELEKFGMPATDVYFLKMDGDRHGFAATDLNQIWPLALRFLRGDPVHSSQVSFKDR